MGLSVVCALAAGGPAGAGPVLDRIKANGSVTVGYRDNVVPWSYRDADGKLVGYSIDVCTELVHGLEASLKLPRLQLKFVPVTTAERIDKVVDGSIDMECATTTNTKARRERVAFGFTYYYAGARMLMRTGATASSLSDLSGKRIAVLKSTTGQQIVEARNKTGQNLLIEVATNSAQAAELVAKGKVDAYINDDIQLYALAKASPGTFKVVGPPMSVEPLAIMYAKTDAELQELVSKRLGDIFREGRIDALYDKWFRSLLPGRDINLEVPRSPLLQDSFRRPSHYATDWTVL